MPVRCICQNPTCSCFFTVPPSQLKAGGGKYCSQACHYAVKTLQGMQTHVQRMCENPACGRVFTATQGEMTKGIKYCSRACYLAAKAVENASRWEEWPCQNPACTVMLRGLRSQRKHQTARRYCSPSCRDAGQLEKRLKKTCQNIFCGKPFTVLYKERKRKYCSYECSCLSLEQRLWNNIEVCVHGKDCIYCCFPWQGARDRNGYGTIVAREATGAKLRYATRMLWETFHQRPMPPKHQAAHWCDFPPCCNPVHVHSATPRANMGEAVARKRWTKRRRGETSPFAKLRKDNIAQIFEWRRQGQTLETIAHTLQVSMGAISDVLHYRTWLHISRSLPLPIAQNLTDA